jgi:hypothetical protein
MNPTQWFATNESFQSFDPKSKLALSQRSLAVQAAFFQPQQVLFGRVIGSSIFNKCHG